MIIYDGTPGDDYYTNISDDSLLAYGYDGNDNFVGNNGDDSLYGGSGDDTLFGGQGNDYLEGGTGNDTLFGYFGDDYLFGGSGSDFLYGDTGDDTLLGGKGNDTLVGAEDNDLLDGGNGSDLLMGYAFYSTATEYDTLTGGPGADTFILGYSDAQGDSPYVSVGYLGNGYATITDFSEAQGDKIQVYGSISDYYLDQSFNYSGGSALDTGIYYQGDLICVVQDNTNLDLSVDFKFV